MPSASELINTLQHRAEQTPHLPAYIFRDKNYRRRVLSWSQVYHLAGRFAGELKQCSVRRGDYVVNSLPNSPERIVTDTGILLLGAVSVNGLCQLADGSDLLHVLRESCASAIVLNTDSGSRFCLNPESASRSVAGAIDTGTKGINPKPVSKTKFGVSHEISLSSESESKIKAGKEYGILYGPWNTLKKIVTVNDDNTVESNELPNLKHVFFVHRSEKDGSADFLTKLGTSQQWYIEDSITRDDVGAVFNTSGSTGFSKLVAYTHGCLNDCFKVSAGPAPPSEPQMNFNISPFGWVGGFWGFYVINGTPRVACDDSQGFLDDMVEFVWRVTQEEKPFRLTTSPVILMPLAERVQQQRERLNDQEGEEDVAIAGALRWDFEPAEVGLGGQPLTRSMMKAACSLGKSVQLVYGATELFAVSRYIVTNPDTYIDHDSGPPFPGFEVKVVSVKDEKERLPVGERGLILVKHPYMMKEYLNNPTATAAAFTADGYFRTGDIGCVDQRGHLIVDGRGSDAIMRGPYIFYPGWLEARIRACPGVMDVLVVGIPDPVLHEELCACVVLASDYKTVQHVREYMEKDIVTSESDPLSPRPRYYLRFESFPVTSSLKPLRGLVKQEAAARIQTGSEV